MLKLFCFKNLSAIDSGVEDYPWEFSPTAEELARVRAFGKEARRKWTVNPASEWQCYAAIRAQVPFQRVSGTNPTEAIRAFVADYDTIATIEAVQECLSQCEPDLLPTYVERSLGNKWRAVWMFDRELLVPYEQFVPKFYEQLCNFLGAASLLAGFDPASLKETQLWTNGGEWYPVSPTPLKSVLLHGVATKIISSADTGALEIPLEIIADEVSKRFPSRWIGDFSLGAHGVRFWDPKADNPRGAFVCKTGCYCLTGLQPFVSWSEIFGYQWVEQQKTLNLGRASFGIYFDNKTYWHESEPGRILPKTREDTLMHLASSGFSRKAGKAPISDAERVLLHVQNNNRIRGAVPIVFRPSGMTTINGERYLNTSTLRAMEPADGPSDPTKHPFLWEFLKDRFFARQENRPFEYFMAWLSHFYRSILTQKPLPGQALFICGPAANGKTLLCMKIIAAIAGGRTTNPYDVLMKNTSFNSDVFSAGVLAINDEESPFSEKERDRFAQGVKSFVVNPEHQYHPKFHDKTTIAWFGRLVVTLNDDAKSVGILPEVNSNTADKMMFFASQPYGKPWPNRYVLEDTILRELPYFCRTLLDWVPAPDIVDRGSRSEVKSYFDPHIVEMSKQQELSFNLVELLKQWQSTGAFWNDADPKPEEWQGTPTELLTHLSEGGQASLPVLRDWTVNRIAKALLSLARSQTPGIDVVKNIGRERIFKITTV